VKRLGIVVPVVSAALSLASIVVPPGAEAQDGTLKEGTFTCGYGIIPPGRPMGGKTYPKRCCRECVRRANDAPSGRCIEWRVKQGGCRRK
jgi:hypothetical protein